MPTSQPRRAAHNTQPLRSVSHCIYPTNALTLVVSIVLPHRLPGRHFPESRRVVRRRCSRQSNATFDIIITTHPSQDMQNPH